MKLAQITILYFFLSSGVFTESTRFRGDTATAGLDIMRKVHIKIEIHEKILELSIGDENRYYFGFIYEIDWGFTSNVCPLSLVVFQWDWLSIEKPCHIG